MNEGEELSISQLRRKRGSLPSPGGDPALARPPKSVPDGEFTSMRTPAGAAEARRARLPFDPARVLEAWARRHRWLLLAAALGALVGLTAGWLRTPYLAEVRVVPREVPQLSIDGPEGQSRPTAERNKPTVVELVHAPDILSKVSAATRPPVSPAWLAARLRSWREGDGGAYVVRMEGRSPREAVELVNLFAATLVSFTRELQTHEVRELNTYIEGKLTDTETELKAVNDELAAFNQESDVPDFDHQTEADLRQLTEARANTDKARIELETTDVRIASLRKAMVTQNPRLVAAQAELNTALLRYTEEHPRVKELRAQIASIDKEMAASENTASPAAAPAEGTLGSQIYLQIVDLQARKAALAREVEAFTSEATRLRDRLGRLSANGWRHAAIKARRESLEATRRGLAARRRDFQLIEESSLGSYRILAPATLPNALAAGRTLRIASVAVGSSAAALLLAALLVAGIELTDPRLKTRADLERVTRLPCLASLGDLRAMDAAALDHWALQAWTALKGQLRRDAGEALICGVTSSHSGEGRSTWVDLLAGAASKCGLEVLTIGLDGEPRAPSGPPPATEGPAEAELPPSPEIALTLGPVLAQELGKLQVRRIRHANAPALHGAWDPAQRKQWESALGGWRGMRDLVMLVDLPPVSAPEAIAALETIPNVIWLSAVGEAKARETKLHVSALRQTGCNLVGTVMNRERTPFWKTGIQARIERCLLKLAGGLLLCASGLHAAEAEKPADAAAPSPSQSAPAPDAGGAQTNTSFSAIPPHKRAAWQEKFTLGAGDVLSITIYGQPDSARPDVLIGPDGRLSYLQAQGLPADGLSVDELRAKLDEVLGKYYRSPRTVVVPIAFRSKRYYLLGSVIRQGVFPLNRPVTIIEALAEARGFILPPEATPNALELADLQRSFLARNGERVSVDFEKLFLEGDLSQNVGLEPNDYLYFPPMDMPEVYVLGEVRQPGAHAFTRDMTVIRAITAGLGFTERAYRQKVLVVRGSLSKPETFVINTAGALRARNTDFRLNPRDIVYVNPRPWIKAEELLDYATRSFINAAVITWTGKTVGPFIER